MAESSPGGPESAAPRAAVTIAGAGPTVVCLHGMLLDRTTFAPQLEGLCARLRIVSYDMRSRDDRRDSPYDLGVLAQDCAELILELGSGPVVLAGMSMGGLVALCVALERSELVRGLVLISSSALSEPPSERERLRAAFAGVRQADRLPEEFVLAEASAHCSRRTRRDQPQIVERLASVMRRQSGGGAWLELESWLSHDLEGSVGRLRCPVLIVHGDEDELVPLEQALATRRLIEHSRLQVVPYAAHAVSLEAPDTVNRAIAAFVDELERGAG